MCITNMHFFMDSPKSEIRKTLETLRNVNCTFQSDKIPQNRGSIIHVYWYWQELMSTVNM